MEYKRLAGISGTQGSSHNGTPMNSSSKAFFSADIGDTHIEAGPYSYEIVRFPRGRICRLVPQRVGDKGEMRFAGASPLTNLQRALITAKQLEWIPEETTLEQCAVEIA